MSEGLKERFINALAATIALYEETDMEHAKRIEALEEKVTRLQGEVHEQQFQIGRLEQDIKDLRRWFSELVKEQDASKQV